MTSFTTATASSNVVGPLCKIVSSFVEAQAKVLAAGVTSPEDWAPMADYLDVLTFRRVGAYLEEFNYFQYCEFMTGWAAGGTRFEMTEFFNTEVGNTVFQEIEERHYRGDGLIRKNVVAVYRFNQNNKIIHLDIYEQAKTAASGLRMQPKSPSACGRHFLRVCNQQRDIAHRSDSAILASKLLSADECDATRFIFSELNH